MSSKSPMPPGYRFYPTEQELVEFYLHHKLENTRVEDIERVIPVVDVYAFDPWQLPEMSGEPCMRDAELEEWFFFTPMQKRQEHGGRPARRTPSGYWKAAGSPSLVYSSNRVVGAKKTTVFYNGRAPFGIKTKWKMNEYKALRIQHAASSSTATPVLRNEFSLFRVYVKSGSLRSFDRRPEASSSRTEAAAAVEKGTDEAAIDVLKLEDMDWDILE